MIKHSRGKLLQFINNIHYVGKTVTICTLRTAYFNYEAGKLLVAKHLWLAKVHKNRESFPLKRFIVYGSTEQRNVTVTTSFGSI